MSYVDFREKSVSSVVLEPLFDYEPFVLRCCSELCDCIYSLLSTVLLETFEAVSDSGAIGNSFRYSFVRTFSSRTGSRLLKCFGLVYVVTDAEVLSLPGF